MLVNRRIEPEKPENPNPQKPSFRLFNPDEIKVELKP